MAYQSDYDGQWYDDERDEPRNQTPDSGAGPTMAMMTEADPAPTPAPSTPSFGGFNADNVFQSWDLNPLAAQTGQSRDTLADQRDQYLQPFYSQYRTQAAAHGGRVNEGDQGLFGDSGFQQFVKTGQAPATFQNTAPTFDDPASRLVEDSALSRYQHLQNPDANSGTALYEKYARQLFDTLQQPVYSAQDESIIKGKAIDSIMTEKDQTQRRWLEEMSRRGIPPSSGPALEGLQRIEQHYGGLLTTVQSEFARNAIDQTRVQRFQALDTAGKLAGSEEGRLREALTTAGIPLQLQDNAFQRNLQLVGAGGSPQSMTSTLLALAQYGQNADAQRNANNAATSNAFMQWLGYTLGGR